MNKTIFDFRLFYLVGDTVIYLNMIEVSPDPQIPLHFDVPLLVSPLDILEHKWDLVTKRVSLKLLFYTLNDLFCFYYEIQILAYRYLHILME